MCVCACEWEGGKGGMEEGGGRKGGEREPFSDALKQC